MSDISYYIRCRRSRPPYVCVAMFLWGTAADFDSDGDSQTVDDTNWTELTLINRAQEQERIDIDPVSDTPLILHIRSEDALLAAKTAYFLAVLVDGDVAQDASGEWLPAEAIPELARATSWRKGLLHTLWECQETYNTAQLYLPAYIAAHAHSSEHREEVQSSQLCGCFYCGNTFPPADITYWVNDETTATCPHCGIDAVIGSAAGYPITEAFLAAMKDCWFGLAE